MLRLAALSTAIALVGMAGDAQAQAVTDQTMSDIQVNTVGECTTLTIKFNIRLQILSYFPKEAGQDLHIRVQPLNPSDLPRLRESLRPPAGYPALRGIEYEGDNPTGPVVSLFFARDMRYEVQAGRSPDTMVIRLFEPGSTGSCAVPGDQPAASTPATGGVDTGADVDAGVPPGLYVVNAVSEPGPLGDLTEGQKSALSGRVAYDTTVERDGVQWHRLRVGFFESKAEAEAFAAQIDPVFPATFVLRVTPEERRAGVSARLDTGALLGQPAGAPTIVATPQQSAEVDQLIADAEAAIAAGENDRAIQLLTNARQLPEAANTARAVELSGLTRERMGQRAQAQAEFEEYLRRYPQSQGADRVRQRLAATGGAGGAAAVPGLRTASASAAPTAWTWDARGSFSQFYFRDESRTKFVDASRPTNDPDIDNRTNLNQLLTSADVTVTGGNDREQIQARAAGSYIANFRSGGRDIEALTALYLDYSDTVAGLQGRIGRQTRNSGGVLGRFDGGWFAWQANDKLRINVVGGFPVLTSRQTHILKERHFFGASVDIGARSSALQTTLYYFDQRANGGFIDRQSVGVEARVLKSRFNAFGLLDYDIKHKEVNLALLTATYNFPDTSSLSLTADYRKSPLLTTSNALIGQLGAVTAQPFEDLRDLRRFYTKPEIYQLARDRTLTVKTLTVSYARPITKHLQANLDFTLTDTGGTPATPATPGTLPIDALPAAGTEYFYGAQLVGTGLFWENDIYILSGRYADTDRSRSYTADVNARVPLSKKVRLSPRARYGYRDDKFVDSSYRQIQPSLRVNYYPMRGGEVELEAGMNFNKFKSNIAGNRTSSTETGVLLSVGYRLDF